MFSSKLLAFISGFEKCAFSFSLTSPKDLITQLDSEGIPPYERENISQQLRGRELERWLQGIALIGGGSVLGGLTGHGLKILLDRNNALGEKFPKLVHLPELLGGILGSASGRMAEQVFFDPIDRVRYREPTALRKRLGEETFPVIGGELPGFLSSPFKDSTS